MLRLPRFMVDIEHAEDQVATVLDARSHWWRVDGIYFTSLRGALAHEFVDPLYGPVVRAAERWGRWEVDWCGTPTFFLTRWGARRFRVTALRLSHPREVGPVTRR